MSLKKEKKVENVNRKALESINSESTIVEIYRVELIEYGRETQKAEIDEMQSFIAKKENKSWLWHAINHETGQVLAFVLGTCTDEVFLQLQKLLEPFGITRFYTDGLKTYSRHLAENNHQVSK